jgi:hypothetical protein
MKNLNEYETPETVKACKTVKNLSDFIAFAEDLERRLAMCRDALDYIANHSVIYRAHRGVAIETLKATEPK